MIQYIWQEFDILPKLISIFDKATSVLLEFEPDDITFITMACDSTVALYAQIGEPIIKLKSKHPKSHSLQFFTKQLKQGILRFRKASHEANFFKMTIDDDGLILESKKDNIKINILKIMAMEGELPELEDTTKALNMPNWFQIQIFTKNLFDGLSGVDKDVEEMEFLIDCDKKNPSLGTLSLKYKHDGFDYSHFVPLPMATATKLSTKKFKSMIQGFLILILRNVIKTCGTMKSPIKKQTKKRKRKDQKEIKNQETKKQEEEEEEYTDDEDINISEDASLCLRIMDEDDPIGILYETNGIVVKACISCKINEELTTEI